MVWQSTGFILVNMVIFLILEITHSKQGIYVKKVICREFYTLSSTKISK